MVQPGSRITVSGAGDINGDDLDDVIFGAPHVGPVVEADNVQDWRGEAYVIFGSKWNPPRFPTPLNLSNIPPDVYVSLTSSFSFSL